MTKEALDKLRVRLSIKFKNGINFTLAGGIIWLLIAYVWTLKFNSYDKSVITFMVGALLLPLALLFSRLFKITWKDPSNPLQPLGLWLNLAQLFYFPFLIFALVKFPDYFVMVYAIITGAHFFPYAWFYKANAYAIFAGIIAIGTMLCGLLLPINMTFIIPMFVSISLIVLTVLLFFDTKKKQLLQNKEQ